ncbi:MAG: fumarylacetoacetate hydrolase family protein [Gammaproteobacteria bacterium]|nr:fumarylacetoacetate hydrolase family protein [Gammaproteobacteria bacterium]
MKIATFTDGKCSRLGLIEDGEVIDTLHAADAPRNMQSFLEGGAAARETLQRLRRRAPRLPLAKVRLQAPIARPPKFLGAALNYSDHIRETGLPRNPYPSFFTKQPTCVIGPGDAIHRPRVSEKLDYEGELGLVIGRRCRHVPRERAAEAIGGFLAVNDVTVRDWQARSPTWTLGKSFDTHGPLGPWLVTPEELGDPQNLGIETRVNGELRQSFRTSEMIFDCCRMVEYLSIVMTLEPGDIIATGTGAGVGVRMTPRGYLRPGDTVCIRIEGIGELQNPVIEEPAATAAAQEG